MAHSLSVVHVHIVFSTKRRRHLIPDELQSATWAYIAGICRQLGCPVHAVGGTADHVHIACRLSRTITQADLVKEIKVASNLWLQDRTDHPFAWQNGYGIFSFGPEEVSRMVTYINNQWRHHHEQDYREEVLALLTRYGAEYDEQYLWD